MLLELISLDKTDVYSYRESDELKRPHENSYSRSLVEQAFVFLRDWLSSSYRRLQSAIQKLFLQLLPPIDNLVARNAAWKTSKMELGKT